MGWNLLFPYGGGRAFECLGGGGKGKKGEEEGPGRGG